MKALTDGKCYRAAINVCWVDILSSVTPAVPMSLKRTQEDANFLYDGPDGPKHAKFPVMIPVDVPEDLEKCTGNWKQISPEEMVHALFLKLAERLEDANITDEELNQWRKIFLSYPAQFEMVAGDDALYWEAWKNRQLFIQGSDCVRRTARQLCHEVYGFKERKQVETGEIFTIAKLQESYMAAKTAESSKTDVNDNFVAHCLSVHEKLLADPEINRCLDKLEERFGLASCLNSIVKLKVIIEKTEDIFSRRWAVNSILDMVEANPMTNEQAWTGKFRFGVVLMLFSCCSHGCSLSFSDSGDKGVFEWHWWKRKRFGFVQVQAEGEGLPFGS